MSQSGIKLKINMEIQAVNSSDTIAKTYKFKFPTFAARRVVMRNLMDFLMARDFYSWLEAFSDALTFDLDNRGKIKGFEVQMQNNTLTFTKRGENARPNAGSS